MACNLLVLIYIDVLLDFIFGKNFQKLMGVWGKPPRKPNPTTNKQASKQTQNKIKLPQPTHAFK